MTKQEIAFTLAAAREKIGAFRVDPSVSTTHTWAYYAEETNSYWLITSASLAQLADMDPEAWAEQDSTAEEYGRKAPRRAP